VGKFTLVILWQNGNSGMEHGLSWLDVQAWMQGIHETASQDLIQQLLIMPDDVDPLRIASRQRLLNNNKQVAA
jgi:hypothetical protein